jgi:cytochrome c oxidase subunit II
MALEERARSGTPDHQRPYARVDWRPMLAIGIVVSILGIAAGIAINWFPLDASKQAKPIDTLWDVLLIASIPVFVLVETVVLFSVWKFRMRPGEELLDGPPIHGNTRLEIIWTAVPAILLVGLCTYAFLVLEDVEQAPAGQELKVRVVGQQFAWTFYYRAGGKEVASPQLHLPVNQSVEFTIQSKDVLHDFWVPAFRMKKDAVPGIDVKYRVTPNRTGTFPIVCAELCGLGHAVMRANATVQPRSAYARWLADLRSGRAAGGGGQATATPQAGGGTADGKAVFTAQANGCGGCHTLKDAGASGKVGPDLDTVLKGKDEAFIRESIVDPNKEIANGYSANIMPPSFGQTLQPAQLDALVKYLSDVTKGG